ncbi:MAG: glycosyltransferase family 2 protein [Ignavibacteria bacterium]|nr:glycosyltransferase family 2 protein [Ignavibacteria bacterium]
MKKGFSIIVCCYNSSELLRETIRSLCSLNSSNDFSAEIIIVDNASTDKTAETASGLLKEFNCPFDFRIESEPKQGLSFARKKGIEVSVYDYILFCDDDNRLEENYLINSFRVMEENKETGALGGVSEPVSDIEFPEWFEDFKQSYSAGRQSENNGEIRSELHSLWGAGMVLRRTAIEGLYSNGFHSLLTDRTGSMLTSGGDTELCYALRLAGWKIRFDNSLKLRHFLPAKRLTWKYLRELNRGFGRQKINFDAYLKNFSSNGSGIKDKDTDWTKRFFFMIKKMRSYGFRKIINFRDPNPGDPEIIRMEKTIGSMQELLRLKNDYGKMITETGKSKWIQHK